MQDLIITRTFGAPIEKVWQAWTDPHAVVIWWAPRGFTNPTCEWNARVDGKINIVMHGPKGTPFDQDFPMTGVFKELVPPNKIVFSSIAVGPRGEPQMEDVTTVTFEDLNGQTKMTLSIHVVNSTPEFAQSLAGMEQGWSQSLDKLGELLSK